jgi:integrase
MPRTKKTRNPFGSIIPRKLKRSGRSITVYDARKRYTNAAGLPDEKFKRCTSHGEALVALSNFQTAIDTELAGESLKAAAPSPVHTLFELIEEFRTSSVVPFESSNGEKIRGYKGNLTHIKTILDEIKTFFSDDPELPSITFDRLRRFKEYLQTKPTIKKSLPAISTVNEKLALLNRVLTVAFEKEWIEVNPFKKGKGLIKQSKRKKRNRPMTFAEEVRLYEVCQPHDQIIPVERKIKGTMAQYTQTFHIDRRNLWSLIIASADTGLRAGEVFGLRWWQIDLDRRVIYLTEEAADRTKTGEPGILPMTYRLHELFMSLWEEHQPPDETVFKQFYYATAWDNACREAGITNLQFRDLRNTASTRMVLSGSSESQVMKVTRHRSRGVFQDHYVSVDLLNAQKIGASMDRFIAEEYEKLRSKGNDKGNATSAEEAKAA